MKNENSDALSRTIIGCLLILIIIVGIVMGWIIRKALKQIQSTRTGLKIGLDASGVTARDAISILNM